MKETQLEKTRAFSHELGQGMSSPDSIGVEHEGSMCIGAGIVCLTIFSIIKHKFCNGLYENVCNDVLYCCAVTIRVCKDGQYNAVTALLITRVYNNKVWV